MAAQNNAYASLLKKLNIPEKLPEGPMTALQQIELEGIKAKKAALDRYYKKVLDQKILEKLVMETKLEVYKDLMPQIKEQQLMYDELLETFEDLSEKHGKLCDFFKSKDWDELVSDATMYRNMKKQKELEAEKKVIDEIMKELESPELVEVTELEKGIKENTEKCEKFTIENQQMIIELVMLWNQQRNEREKKDESEKSFESEVCDFQNIELDFNFLNFFETQVNTGEPNPKKMRRSYEKPEKQETNPNRRHSSESRQKRPIDEVGDSSEKENNENKSFSKRVCFNSNINLRTISPPQETAENVVQQNQRSIIEIPPESSTSSRESPKATQEPIFKVPTLPAPKKTTKGGFSAFGNTPAPMASQLKRTESQRFMRKSFGELNQDAGPSTSVEPAKPMLPAPLVKTHRQRLFPKGSKVIKRLIDTRSFAEVQAQQEQERQKREVQRAQDPPAPTQTKKPPKPKKKKANKPKEPIPEEMQPYADTDSPSDNEDDNEPDETNKDFLKNTQSSSNAFNFESGPSGSLNDSFGFFNTTSDNIDGGGLFGESTKRKNDSDDFF